MRRSRKALHRVSWAVAIVALTVYGLTAQNQRRPAAAVK